MKQDMGVESLLYNKQEKVKGRGLQSVATVNKMAGSVCGDFSPLLLALRITHREAD